MKPMLGFTMSLEFSRCYTMLTKGGRPKKGKLEPAILLMLEGKLEERFETLERRFESGIVVTRRNWCSGR